MEAQTNLPSGLGVSAEPSESSEISWVEDVLDLAGIDEALPKNAPAEAGQQSAVAFPEEYPNVFVTLETSEAIAQLEWLATLVEGSFVCQHYQAPGMQPWLKRNSSFYPRPPPIPESPDQNPNDQSTPSSENPSQNPNDQSKQSENPSQQPNDQSTPNSENPEQNPKDQSPRIPTSENPNGQSTQSSENSSQIPNGQWTLSSENHSQVPNGQWTLSSGNPSQIPNDQSSPNSEKIRATNYHLDPENPSQIPNGQCALSSGNPSQIPNDQSSPNSENILTKNYHLNPSDSTSFPGVGLSAANAYGPSQKVRKGKRVIESDEGRRCLHCDTDKTPQWRAGPQGPKTLCNACGVRFKSGGLLPEYRPAASPTFSISEHSNSQRKVVELRRQKEQQQQPHEQPQQQQQQLLLLQQQPYQTRLIPIPPTFRPPSNCRGWFV